MKREKNKHFLTVHERPYAHLHATENKNNNKTKRQQQANERKTIKKLEHALTQPTPMMSHEKKHHSKIYKSRLCHRRRRRQRLRRVSSESV